MEKVKVYYFTVWDQKTGENKRMPRPATLKTITAINGIAIEETMLEVEVSRLDGNGFYSYVGSCK